MMAGLAKPTTGSVSLFGRDIASFSPAELQQLRARRLGFIFQTFLLIDALTVLENVSMVLRFAGHGRREADRLGMGLLAHLGMESRARHFPPGLSQGEKQRVAVARAMARDTELILADEPTGSLESQQGFLIIRLLHDHARMENRCVVVVSHDRRLADFADRIIFMEDGWIRASGKGKGGWR
jgi:putative ABC transport system ATP-binding protein